MNNSNDHGQSEDASSQQQPPAADDDGAAEISSAMDDGSDVELAPSGAIEEFPSIDGAAKIEAAQKRKRKRDRSAANAARNKDVEQLRASLSESDIADEVAGTTLTAEFLLHRANR